MCSFQISIISNLNYQKWKTGKNLHKILLYIYYILYNIYIIIYICLEDVTEFGG